MTERVLLLVSHGIAEYDDIRMFHDLGYEVFCPGGYADPAHPGETLRPALPQVPSHPDLQQACIEQRERHAADDASWAIDWAKADLHPDLIDWADVIICHHFPERWLGGQWNRIRDKRVVWRTCGQSNPDLELTMAGLEGLQIVRYSPKEREAFGAIGAFAGEDALIRFGKYPRDYGPWIGDWQAIGNVTQDMAGRGDATGLTAWLMATRGQPAMPAGKGSEQLPGGVGELSYEDMLDYLRHIRVYYYTGTRPASYTLGLIEAMLTGTPVVSISAQGWGRGWGGAPLFEGEDIVPKVGVGDLLHPLMAYEIAERLGQECRDRAIELFGITRIGKQWTDFLGAPVPKPVLVA